MVVANGARMEMFGESDGRCDSVERGGRCIEEPGASVGGSAAQRCRALRGRSLVMWIRVVEMIFGVAAERQD
jgi:hypothetical protein